MVNVVSFLFHLDSNLVIMFQVRDPMLAVYFFLIDVSMIAIQTGATAAACSAINQVISDLPVSFMPIFSMLKHVIAPAYRKFDIYLSPWF